MLPLVRYLTVDLLRSQRFFPPVFLFLIALGVFVGGDPGAALPTYGSLAMVLYPLGVWLAVAVDNAEDPVQRGVTVTAAGGGWGKVIAALATVSASGVLILAVVGTAWPAVVSAQRYRPAEIALGLAAQLACGWAGTAVGMLCARPVLRKVGWSILIASTAIVATFSAGRHVPPVGTMLGLLGNKSPDLGGAVGTVAISFAVAVAMLGASGAIVFAVARRRG
jgi:hypothetical protein